MSRLRLVAVGLSMMLAGAGSATGALAAPVPEGADACELLHFTPDEMQSIFGAEFLAPQSQGALSEGDDTFTSCQFQSVERSADPDYPLEPSVRVVFNLVEEQGTAPKETFTAMKDGYKEDLRFAEEQGTGGSLRRVKGFGGKAFLLEQTLDIADASVGGVYWRLVVLRDKTVVEFVVSFEDKKLITRKALKKLVNETFERL